jgi:hypothetical protein
MSKTIEELKKESLLKYAEGRNAAIKVDETIMLFGKYSSIAKRAEKHFREKYNIPINMFFKYVTTYTKLPEQQLMKQNIITDIDMLTCSERDKFRMYLRSIK